MKNKILSLFVLCPVAVLAQEKDRKLLKGKAFANEVKVEYIAVQNLSTLQDTISDKEGNFALYAKPGDSLLFTGQLLSPLKRLLSDKDFSDELLVVKMKRDSTMLKEVVVTGLTGNLAYDSKHFKPMPKGSSFDAAEINKDILPGNTQYGINFRGLFTQIFRKKPKSGTHRVIVPLYQPDKTFAETVRDRYPVSFFTKTLKIPEDEITFFIDFCDRGRASFELLAQQQGFNLTDYLTNKAAEYLKEKGQ